MKTLLLLLALQTQVPAKPHLKQGDLDSKGRPVLYAVGHIPIVLKSPAGVMVINVGDEKKPKAQYVLATSKPPKVVATTDWKVFAAALAKLKKGTLCIWYDKCTVFADRGVEKESERVERAMQRKALKRGGEPGRQITCVCEEMG